MFYLSQILGNKVKDSAENVVGRLLDVVVKQDAGVYSPVEFLLVKEKKTKKECLIPYKYVENFGLKEITLKTLYCNIITNSEIENYLFLEKDVLDQQIVDIDGVRIVRVNDLKIGNFQEKMCILGIDISFNGILRRLGLEKLDFLGLFKATLIEWRKVQPIHGRLQLKTLADGLVKLHPADLANLVEKLNLNDGSILLRTLDKATAARVMEELHPEVQKILVKRWGPEKASELISKMSVDELADLMQSLSDEEAREILEKLPPDTKMQKVKKFLEYEEDTAGGLMSAEYITAHPETTVAEVISKIKKVFSEFASIHFIYIIDREGKIQGVVSVRRLLVSDKDQTMEKIMRSALKMPVATVGQDILEIASLMTKYNLMSIAVVDDNQKLLGLITVDDLMRHFVPHA